MSGPSADDYAIKAEAGAAVEAPELPYRPRDPERYRPGIGLVGCGGVAGFHLDAYRRAGYRVVALCDRSRERAEARRAEFYPQAAVVADALELVGRPDVEVVDVATHPEGRPALVEAAISAGKHVLSQKPFVLDLDEGERLVELADANGVRLAVNQNGRWAPHLAYMREAVRAGLVGEVTSVHVSIHWDHTWTAGTPFEEVPDLVLYDFAIHWFDFLASLVGARTRRVQASRSFAARQAVKPPLLGQAIVELDGGQASLVFDANVRRGALDHTFVGGTEGSLVSEGPDLNTQAVALHTARGVARPRLRGAWFNDGFHGAMAELLRAVEEDREPENGARGNLTGLALCFAAVRAAHEGRAQVPFEVRRLEGGSPARPPGSETG